MLRKWSCRTRGRSMYLPSKMNTWSMALLKKVGGIALILSLRSSSKEQLQGAWETHGSSTGRWGGRCSGGVWKVDCVSGTMGQLEKCRSYGMMLPKNWTHEMWMKDGRTDLVVERRKWQMWWMKDMGVIWEHGWSGQRARIELVIILWADVQHGAAPGAYHAGRIRARGHCATCRLQL